MKRYQLLLLASLFSCVAIAQEDEPVNLNEINDKKHEIRIDAAEGLIVPALDLSYEYVLSRYSGVGASINFNLDSDDFAGQNFSFTPYYRQYFFNKKDYGARGFFAEGLLNYSSGTVDFFTGNDFSPTEEDWSAFGIGFAIGQKWISQNGFIVEK